MFCHSKKENHLSPYKCFYSLKEKVTPKSEFFLSSPIKSLYRVKLLTEGSASEVHVLSKEAQNSASVAAILKQVLNGQAAKRNVIRSKRFCLVLEVI